MYFSVVPNIIYDEKPIKYPFSDADRVIAKNFFRRYKLNDDVFSYAVFFNKYAIPVSYTHLTLPTTPYV